MNEALGVASCIIAFLSIYGGRNANQFERCVWVSAIISRVAMLECKDSVTFQIG
jgi:hypothetical protein